LILGVLYLLYKKCHFLAKNSRFLRKNGKKQLNLFKTGKNYIFLQKNKEKIRFFLKKLFKNTAIFFQQKLKKK